MTATGRILLNFIATYGRSLFTLVCGLFTSRWVLKSLGEVDFGLYGLVGGLTAFVAFFNSTLSTAVGRYYAYQVGVSRGHGPAGLEACREWFNTAALIHTVVPVVLIALGYPLADYAVRHWLEIPPARLGACVWVLRFACLSCFLGMASVPYNAMYIAKQYIAELTVYTFVTTAVNVCFVYYMVVHPGDWLAKYACWTALLGVLPQLVITFRAFVLFPECRFRRGYLFQLGRVRELFLFASHRFAGALAVMLQSQGMAVLVNKCLGVNRNASMSVGNSLSGHAQTLAAALAGALSPAIATAAGAGDYALMRKLAMRACKFGAVLTLLFVLPVSLEAGNILRLWLGTPPALSDKLCLCMLAVLTLENISSGHFMVIFAMGKIAGYQYCIGGAGLLAVPLAWLFLRAGGWDLVGVGLALMAARLGCVIVRIYFARRHGGLSGRVWLCDVFFPVLLVSVIAVLPGWLVSVCFRMSFFRLLGTAAVTEAVFLPLVWFFILDGEERRFVTDRAILLGLFFRKRIPRPAARR